MTRLINRKIKDSNLIVSGHSRADDYWRSVGFKELYKKFRSPMAAAPPEEPYEYLKSRQGVVGVEFGNWVPIDMRFNYLVGSIVAIADINKITGLKKFGLDRLSLAYGSRGHSKAMAHFEPGTDTINLTRYKKSIGRLGFITSGGVGALAHEYGHFLDYYFGRIVPVCDSGSQALSGGRSTVTTFTDKELRDPGLWGAMSRLLQRIIWEGKEKTAYYTRATKISGGEYWIRRNELFARCFEQYINYKLSQKNVSNRLLTQRKYEWAAYWTDAEFKPIVPLMAKVISRMKSSRKTKSK